MLSHYVRVGVGELDQDKLTPLLKLKYHNSIADALADLGQAGEIGQLFAGFQKYLCISVKSNAGSSIDSKIVDAMPLAPIGVIGAGNIGRTLGVGWLRAGYPVTFGVRDPAADSAHQTRSQLGVGARVLSIPAALASANVVVLALPGSAVDDFLAEHGAALSNRIVVDAANRAFGSTGPMNSVAAIRAHAEVAGIVRAFNSIGWENMADPRFDGTIADLLYCADPAAQATAEELIAALGLRPVLVGDLDQVHLVDALTGLWAALAYGQKRGRNLAFKVLERASGPGVPGAQA